MPSWLVVEAFIQSCGQDPARWRQLWEVAGAESPPADRSPANGDSPANSERPAAPPVCGREPVQNGQSAAPNPPTRRARRHLVFSASLALLGAVTLIAGASVIFLAGQMVAPPRHAASAATRQRTRLCALCWHVMALTPTRAAVGPTTSRSTGFSCCAPRAPFRGADPLLLGGLPSRMGLRRRAELARLDRAHRRSPTRRRSIRAGRLLGRCAARFLGNTLSTRTGCVRAVRGCAVFSRCSSVSGSHVCLSGPRSGGHQRAGCPGGVHESTADALFGKAPALITDFQSELR